MMKVTIKSIMLSVVMLGIFMLCVIMLSVSMLCVIMHNDILCLCKVSL
jgi:hypothetical protein